MPESDPGFQTPPPVDDLQFQRAEFAGDAAPQSCAFCSATIQDSYYRMGGATACPTCALLQRDMLGRHASSSVFLKAVLYGSGAALAGAVINSILFWFNFQWALVAILIGYMVGRAIRHATSGQTSRIYQVLAVALTYFAFTVSYLPALLREAPKVPFLFLFLTALILPVIELFSSPLWGLIGLLIIGYGLKQAWDLTRPISISIEGPFQVGPK